MPHRHERERRAASGGVLPAVPQILGARLSRLLIRLRLAGPPGLAGGSVGPDDIPAAPPGPRKRLLP